MKLLVSVCSFLQAPFTFVILDPNNLIAPCSQISTLWSLRMWQTKFRIHIKQQVNYSCTYFNIYVFRCETDQSSFSVTVFLCIAADIASICIEVSLHKEFEAFAQYQVESKIQNVLLSFFLTPNFNALGIHLSEAVAALTQFYMNREVFWHEPEKLLRICKQNANSSKTTVILKVRM